MSVSQWLPWLQSHCVPIFAGQLGLIVENMDAHASYAGLKLLF